MTTNVAIIRDGTVENVIVVAAIEDVQTPAWKTSLGSAALVPVPDGVACSPGWAWDGETFTAPPVSDPAPQ